MDKGLFDMILFGVALLAAFCFVGLCQWFTKKIGKPEMKYPKEALDKMNSRNEFKYN